jgi:transposase
MLFVGVDWAEDHHDICLMDEQGKVLASKRVDDSLHGVAQVHTLLAPWADDPAQVVIGIETDRGLFVQSLLGSGYQVYAINPLAVSHYRERHTIARAKSDPADAKLLADVVRTDRHNHHPVAGDSEVAQAVKVLARSHQQLIWTRQRQVNQLRSSLREFYPGVLSAFDDLDSRDALAILAIAPSPDQGRRLSLSKIASTLRRAGRQRNVERTAAKIQVVLRTPQLEVPPVLALAYANGVKARVRVIVELSTQIAVLEKDLTAQFEAHPDAEIITSLPGLGPVLGARVLAEFGDDPTRFADSKARKNYAGCSPITVASGRMRVVHARFPRKTRLVDVGFLWAFSSLTGSPGARSYYDACRARHQTHAQALRTLANRWFGILHGCLRHRTLYAEEAAWPQAKQAAA